jgi:hypothetical protein
VDSGTFKNQIINALNMEYSINPTNANIIDFHIQRACTDLAQVSKWEALLKETTLTCTTNGSIIIPEPCLPSMVFVGGVGNQPSWRRVLAVEFDDFCMLRNSRGQGFYYRTGTQIQNRYTIDKFHENKDETKIQLLGQVFASRPIKVIYYPLMPAVSNFPPQFIPILYDKVLFSVLPTFSENTTQFALEILKRSIKEQTFNMKRREQQIELTKFARNRNASERSFIEQGISDLLFASQNSHNY